MLAANVRFALRALRAHRLRSALTMLGIVIGVAAVVVMVAVGAGARERVAAQIRSLGANLIGVSPGSLTMGGVRLGRGAAPRLDEGDAAAIEAEVPGVVVAAPALYTRVQFTAGPANWQAMVRGVTPGFFTAREWDVADGREMATEDHHRAAKVVLLGTTLRDKLVEAVTLATLGGCFGVLVGVAGSLAAAGAAGWPVLVDLGTVALALVVAAAVGVFFGFYPARRAAQLEPIVALRFE